MSTRVICRIVAVTVFALSLVSAQGIVHAANSSKLSTYETGTPVVGVPCGTNRTLRAAVLMGGGIDVKDAYTWMISKIYQCSSRASSTATAPALGNFVVIRARGNPDYDRFIFKLGPLASVQTLVIPSEEAANDPALEPYIQNAAAIWITGGDQADYYNVWKGTLLEELVVAQIRDYGIPVGGTSAGMMMLSEINYLADPYGATSSQALADPYLPDYMDLQRDFWTSACAPRMPCDTTPFAPLRHTVTDSHLDTRDRMGRLVTFLARTINDRWAKLTEARAIGVDEQSALLLEYDTLNANKSATCSGAVGCRVVANEGVAGAAYFLNAAPSSTLTVRPSAPLTFTRVQVDKLPAVPLSSTAQPHVQYQFDVRGGVLYTYPPSGIY